MSFSSFTTVINYTPQKSLEIASEEIKYSDTEIALMKLYSEKSAITDQTYNNTFYKHNPEIKIKVMAGEVPRKKKYKYKSSKKKK